MLRFTLGSVGVLEVCLVGFYKGGFYKGFKGFIVVFPKTAPGMQGQHCSVLVLLPGVHGLGLFVFVLFSFSGVWGLELSVSEFTSFYRFIFQTVDSVSSASKRPSFPHRHAKGQLKCLRDMQFRPF